MSYGPDGLCPKDLSVGYASGAIGSSILGVLGLTVLLITVPLGALLVADGDTLAGIAWMGGGAALAVAIFGLAGRRESWMNRTPPHVWSFDKRNMAISLILMLVGVWIYFFGRDLAGEGRIAGYTSALGVAVFLVALLWFSLSVRD